MSAPLLDVDHIAVHYHGRPRLFDRSPTATRAVNDVSFRIDAGRTYGLIGESGSGKSTLARAVLRLVPVERGTIRVDGRDISQVRPDEHLDYCRQVQGVFQEPFSSLSAFRSVEETIGDVLTRHFDVKGRERLNRVSNLLKLVGLSAEFAHRYVDELSGGQCQRVSLARALSVDPELVIFDEVTSALDMSVRSQIINLLRGYQDRTGAGYLFISHDLEAVRHIAHEVGVMCFGYLVETGTPQAIYAAPAHPYSEMLGASIPQPNPLMQRSRRNIRRQIVVNLPPPSPTSPLAGCPLAARCAAAMDICRREMPEPTTAHHGGTTRCHLHTSGPCLGGESIVPFMREARRPDIIRQVR
ncbi:MAG: ABC transporter ATP-binding protein [Acidimicrobiales bacterium]|nr:ABC transporter ATP-binding protein [Acidimicrobiales bacterium]RZV44710.1 MAG: ABC transporter ATP-binding protein [Acidimicrobiales bacterium]